MKAACDMKTTDLGRIVSLVRETSASLPDDVISALRSAKRRERRGGSASVVLQTILDNCALAARNGTPLCQDTGTLTFFVDERLRRRVTPALLKKAVARATALGCLRKNAIDSVTGKSHDDNCADGAPVVHYCGRPGVTLLMKGGARRTCRGSIRCRTPRSERDATSTAFGDAS